MNFQMALFSLAMIEIFSYFFYSLVNKDDDEKKEADSKDDPLTPLRMTKKDQKTTRPLPAKKNKIATIDNGGTSIVTRSSGNARNSVNININTYSTGTYQKLKKDDCNHAVEPESFTESLSETNMKSTDKEGKVQAKVYLIPQCTELKQKKSIRTK